MNRRPPGFPLAKAVEGLHHTKAAEGLSPRTLVNYRQHTGVWLEYMGEKTVEEITTQDVRAFLSWLRTDYRPRRITGGNDQRLSAKTIRNFWVALSSFFRWASLEFDLPQSPMQRVAAPKFTEASVEPFGKAEVQALLKACKFMREAETVDRRSFAMRRPTARRDEALMLVLLDTGLRASEICALRVQDVNQRTGRVEVRHGVSGGAKGGKGRTVYLGKVARRALWRYLAEREDGEEPDAPLFLGVRDRPMSRDGLRQLTRSLGEKAGVEKCHPHRFRHTFAITYLRSGGDVFTLQALLGHSSLDMVQRYARIAQVDIERAHRKASPADNWRL